MITNKIRLSKLCKIITKGTTPTSIGFTFSDQGIRFLRVQNVSNGKVNYEQQTLFIDEVTNKALARSQILGGDVLISIAGTIGRAGIVPDNAPPLNCNQALAIVRTNGDIYRPYLRNWLESNDAQSQMIGATVTGTISNLSLTQIGNLQIPLPPLEEQKRIAEILDRASSLISKRKDAIAKLDTLTQSIFLEMFGDPIANLKGWKRLLFSELLDNIDSGWSPVCSDHQVSNGEWGVLKLGAVTWCEYNPNENKALLPNVKPNLALEVKVGDLLFTRKNTYELVAACVLVRETPPHLMMPDLIFRFRLCSDAPIDSCFLHQLLIYPTKRSNIQKLAGGSSGSMPNISKAKLQTISIEIPPLPLQKEFAQRVEAVEKLKATHRASLTELQSLFASLQHRAFRGEL